MFSLRAPGGNATISMVGANVGVAMVNPQAAFDVGGLIQGNSQLAMSATTTGATAMAALGNPASDRVVLLKGAAGTYPYALGVGPSTMYASVPTGAAIALQVGGTTYAQVTTQGLTATGNLSATGMTVTTLTASGNISAAAVGVNTLTATGLAGLGTVTVAGGLTLASNLTQTANAAVALSGPTLIYNTLGVTQPVTCYAGLNMLGAQVLNMGSDVAGKEASAGKIAYQGYSPFTNLDIIGAGNVAGSRSVMLYDNATVGGALTVNAAANVGGQLTVAGTSTLTGVVTVPNSLNLKNAPVFTGGYSELANVPYDQVYIGVANATPALSSNVTTYYSTGAVLANGQAIFYPTLTGKAGGGALFTTIWSVQASCVSTATTAGTTPYTSIKSANTAIIVLNCVAPGGATASYAASGTPIFLQVMGQ